METTGGNRSYSSDSAMNTIYILGAGAIGFPLAAYLTNAGRPVIAVRTSKRDVPEGTVMVAIQDGENRIRARVKTVSLAKLDRLNGMIVITTKSHVNDDIANQIKSKGATGPVVVMQNGLGVEKPFVDAQLRPVYRCVLYATAQAVSAYTYRFRPVDRSPIGTVEGDEVGLAACVERLTTDAFPFRSEANIQREVWKKAIANAAFNSICPLLDVDNGVFARDAAAADLAREIVSECVALTDRLNVGLSKDELMEQIMLISKRSEGQYISTLQDIRAGRPTEIASLNLEIARVAAAMRPRLQLPRTELLGKMIVAKSVQHSRAETEGQGQEVH